MNAVRVLLDLHASEDKPDRQGSLPIHRAAEVGSIPVLHLLAGDKLRLRKQTESGCMPIHLAARGGFASAVRVLIDNGSPVEIGAGDVADTPLLLAADGDHDSIV